MPKTILMTAVLAVALIATGCGGRDDSWSREKAPQADAGDHVRLIVRGYDQRKDKVFVHFEVANDGDETVTFPLDMYKGQLVDQDPHHESTKTYLTAEDRRITIYTIDKAGKYDFAGKASQMKALGQGWANARITVAPHKIERLTLQFSPRPNLKSAKSSFALHLDDLKRGETALKPLAVEIK